MSDFLDEQALHSNENSELREQNFSVVMQLAHPTLPHAAALCLESRELLVVGRANGLISIAYLKPVEDSIFRSLVRDRRMTFENTGYVEKVLGSKSKVYKQLRQIPVSLYSSEAKLLPLQPQITRPDGKLFNVSLSKIHVRIPSPKGGHVTVDCPPVSGEMLINHEAAFTEFKAFDQGIEISGERYPLRQIDRALLAALSFIEW